MGICFLCFWGALGDAVHGELVIEVFSCWKGLYERHINTWEAQEQRNCQLNSVGYVSNMDTNIPVLDTFLTRTQTCQVRTRQGKIIF